MTFSITDKTGKSLPQLAAALEEATGEHDRLRRALPENNLRNQEVLDRAKEEVMRAAAQLKLGRNREGRLAYSVSVAEHRRVLAELNLNNARWQMDSHPYDEHSVEAFNNAMAAFQQACEDHQAAERNLKWLRGEEVEVSA